MMEETTAYEVSPEQAFIQAKAGFELFGQPLRKFSLSRKIAAQQMGCMAPAINEGWRESLLATGLYPGALNDTIIVLWLCLLEDSSEQTLDKFRAGEYTPDRAIGNPAQALAKAREWAESVGIDGVSSQKFLEGYRTYLQIMFGIDASAFEVSVEKTGQPTREQTGPKERPANRRSRTSSRASTRFAGTTARSSGKK